MEIERKFLVERAPSNLKSYQSINISQVYIDLGENGLERRIRRTERDGEVKYYYTEKGQGTLSRVENEREICQKEYDELLKNAVTDMLTKTRYLIPIASKLIAELDIYSGSLSGLMTVEVEFESISEALSFSIPEWFGKEVTEDKTYKNKNLAKRI